MLSDVHRVFAIDALASSHPLSSKEEDIQKPAQISELFDAISYSKVAPLSSSLPPCFSHQYSDVSSALQTLYYMTDLYLYLKPA